MQIFSHIRYLLLFSILCTNNVYSNKSADPICLITTQYWAGYSQLVDGKQYYFMIGKPQESYGKYTKRGETYMVIRHCPMQNERDVIRIKAGYTYKRHSDVNVTVISANKGSKIFSYQLFTDEDMAWCIDDETDKKLANQINKIGKKMVVQGTSFRGTKTRDVYSLNGSWKVYKVINQAAGYRN